MCSAGDSAALPASGFPHSGIHGSKAVQRLTVAYRSRPRPSSTLDAKASTMCPYYLDGDQRPSSCEPGLVIPVSPPTHRKGATVAAVQFSRAVREGCLPTGTHEGAATWHAVSQNSTACAGSGPPVWCVVSRLLATSGRISGAKAGPARFGRRTRPHGRGSVDAHRLRPRVAADGTRRRRAVRAPFGAP